MPVPTVQVVEDSINGGPLPEDIEPLTISLGRRSWQLFLSDANREKILCISILASTAKQTAARWVRASNQVLIFHFDSDSGSTFEIDCRA